MKIQSRRSSFPSDESISNQLERMLGSPDFRATPQQAAFFKFVVNQTLAGKTDQIKGYTVATRVFGRGPDFDQSIDPVVSIQAGRLRRAIERYYLTSGQNDATRIDIPKGTYVPTFRNHLPDKPPITAESAAPVSDRDIWPAVLVRPLANLTADPADDYVSIGLATELAHALSHYREIRVLEARNRMPQSPSQEPDIDFSIDGSVRCDPAGITVEIRLHDATKCVQIWSGKYQGNLEAARMISFQENVAAEVAFRMAGGNALIPRHLAGFSRNKSTPELTTYEAMLRYWVYDTLHTRQSYVRASRALAHAVAHKPDCGQAWSMLACLYADNYGLEMVDPAEPLEKAAVYARRGVHLDPTNRRARAILAYVRLMEDNLREARCDAETAYRLHSYSLMYSDVIGWLMCLTGEWERGVSIIKKAMQLNPYCRPWVRHALWLNWFRKSEYKKAYRESHHFMMPELFWDTLLKASACGHLGRIEEGQESVGALLALKPDFARRGRILIGRYVKFEDIAARIIEGLGLLGMNIEP